MIVKLQLGAASTRVGDDMAPVYAGRDSTCQLATADQSLSRQHAEISVKNGVVYIQDLGSANGTWVDGVRLTVGLVPLRPGQQIWLGHVSLSITWEADGSRTAIAHEPPAELLALIKARQHLASSPASHLAKVEVVESDAGVARAMVLIDLAPVGLASGRPVFETPPAAQRLAVQAPVSATPVAAPGAGVGIAALVLGIIGLVDSLVPCLGMYAIPLTVLAIIFGTVGMRVGRPGRGMATAGFICGLIGTALASYWIYVAVEAREILQKSLDDYQRQQQLVPPRPSGPACYVRGRQGVCIDISRCSGTSTAGLCEGAASIQCCVE